MATSVKERVVAKDASSAKARTQRTEVKRLFGINEEVLGKGWETRFESLDIPDEELFEMSDEEPSK